MLNWLTSHTHPLWKKNMAARKWVKFFCANSVRGSMWRSICANHAAPIFKLIKHGRHEPIMAFDYIFEVLWFVEYFFYRIIGPVSTGLSVTTFYLWFLPQKNQKPRAARIRNPQTCLWILLAISPNTIPKTIFHLAPIHRYTRVKPLSGATDRTMCASKLKDWASRSQAYLIKYAHYFSLCVNK